MFLRDTEIRPAEEVFVRKNLLGRHRVLDLGCGFGVWAPVVTSQGSEYLGVDAERRRTDYANLHYKSASASFVCADCRYFVPTHPPDAVLLVTVLQHMLLPDAVAVLQNTVKWLSPQSSIVLVEASLLEVDEKECNALYAKDDWPEHLVPKPLSVLRAATPHRAWQMYDHDKFVILQRTGARAI